MYQLYHALQYHSQLIFVFICFVWRVKPLCCLWLLKPFPESLISIPSRWCWRNTVFRWSFQVRRSWEPSCRLVFQVFGVASLIHIWQSLDMSFLPRTTLRGFVWKYIPCFQTFLHGNRQFYWEYEYTVPQLDVWITAGVAQVMEVPWACLLLPETCRCVPQKNANLKVDWWYYSNPQKQESKNLILTYG